MANKLQQLRNIGPKTATQLNAIGVLNIEDLQKRGALETYIDLKQAFQGSISLNFLYALTGALENRDWRELAATRRGELLTELETRLDLIQSFNLK